jgi:hypothetical protein
MKASFASRARNAARRWRLRIVYEHARPELATADVMSRVDPALAASQFAPPFSRLLEAHLARTPRALWENAPAVPPDAIARARAGQWRLFDRSIVISAETDWHRDPVFGARWPRHYTGSLSYYREGGDVVTLWHLNKMMFLLDLAAAYRTTRDPDLAARVYDLIDSWCVANPYLVGMNWVSPLDIATRLAVWSHALAAVADAPLPDEARAARIVRSIVRQADHVASHLSEWPIPNNHLMGEVALLYAFAACWPIWTDARAWMARAEALLASEVQRQVLDDGFQYEASVNYHAYALDFVLVYLHAKAMIGEAPHPTVLAKARSMATAYLELVMPSGRRPRIGDDSIDRFFVLAHGIDAPPLSAHESAFADAIRPEFAVTLAAARWGRDLLDVRVPARHARHFAQAGISIARDSDAAVAFVHGPQHRHLFSHGHMHADAGSFELELDGVPVIVDAGTYVYFADPEARTYFKGARAHNAPVVDDVEPMRSLEPFRWETVAGGEYLGFGATPGAVGIGNRRKLQGVGGVPMEHTRALVIARGTVVVLDSIRARDESSVAPHTHLARICFRTPTPPGTASADGRRAGLADPRHFARVVEAFSDQRSHVEVVDDPTDRNGWYSRWYGDLQRGVAVRVSAEFESSVLVASVIRGADVSVTPVRLDAADTVVAIESHAERRLIRVCFEPFAIVVGGRTLVGRGADAASLAEVRAPASRTSSTPAWLDELTAG